MYAGNRTGISTIWALWVVVGLLAILALASCQPLQPPSELPAGDSTPAQASGPSTDTDSSSADTLNEQGIAYATAGNYEQAIEDF